MGDNTKKTGRFRRLLLRLIGPKMSQWAVLRLLRKKIDWSPAALPADLGRSSEILFILPTDKLEMIFMLECLFSILGKYKNSNLTFICPATHVPFINNLKSVRVITFNPDEFSIYGAEFNRLVGELSVKSFDICVMLEKRYSLAHLYLVGLSRAHLRVGWDAGRSYPFLNIRLVSTERDGASLWERNLEATKILDADVESRLRWGVQKSAAEEVVQLLSERKLKKDPALICVDLASIEASCGKEWCAELAKTLKSTYGIGQFCVFGGMDGDGLTLKDAPFPTLPPMSIPKTAALIAHTDLIIAGFGHIFGLAQISSKSKLVPILSKNHAEKYCKNNERIMPVIFSEKPGQGDIRTVVRNIKELLSRNNAPVTQLSALST